MPRKNRIGESGRQQHATWKIPHEITKTNCAAVQMEKSASGKRCHSGATEMGTRCEPLKACATATSKQKAACGLHTRRMRNPSTTKMHEVAHVHKLHCFALLVRITKGRSYHAHLQNHSDTQLTYKGKT